LHYLAGTVAAHTGFVQFKKKMSIGSQNIKFFLFGALTSETTSRQRDFAKFGCLFFLTTGTP
jgi:hypothetical protein